MNKRHNRASQIHRTAMTRADRVPIHLRAGMMALQLLNQLLLMLNLLIFLHYTNECKFMIFRQRRFLYKLSWVFTDFFLRWLFKNICLLAPRRVEEEVRLNCCSQKVYCVGVWCKQYNGEYRKWLSRRKQRADMGLVWLGQGKILQTIWWQVER